MKLTPEQQKALELNKIRNGEDTMRTGHYAHGSLDPKTQLTAHQKRLEQFTTAIISYSSSQHIQKELELLQQDLVDAQKRWEEMDAQNEYLAEEIKRLDPLIAEQKALMQEAAIVAKFSPDTIQLGEDIIAKSRQESETRARINHLTMQNEHYTAQTIKVSIRIECIKKQLETTPKEEQSELQKELNNEQEILVSYEEKIAQKEQLALELGSDLKTLINQKVALQDELRSIIRGINGTTTPDEALAAAQYITALEKRTALESDQATAQTIIENNNLFKAEEMALLEKRIENYKQEHPEITYKIEKITQEMAKIDNKAQERIQETKSEMEKLGVNFDISAIEDWWDSFSMEEALEELTQKALALRDSVVSAFTEWFTDNDPNENQLNKNTPHNSLTPGGL